MILYIDETENDDYFILAGLLADNRASVDMAYRHFKNRIKNFSLNARSKEQVYREFKSVVLDRHYQRIKNIMLEEIDSIDNHFVIYSTQVKKDARLTQEVKESIYIQLITAIAKKCDIVSIIYDNFNNPKFESRINAELLKLDNVDIAVARDSQEEPGLQFADNLCSVIRLHISNADKYGYYDLIASKVIEV